MNDEKRMVKGEKLFISSRFTIHVSLLNYLVYSRFTIHASRENLLLCLVGGLA